MSLHLNTNTTLPPDLQRAVGEAVLHKVKQDHGDTTPGPVAGDLHLEYNRLLGEAMEAAAFALQQRASLPTGKAEIAAFASKVAADTVPTPFHPSAATLPLQLDKPLELSKTERLGIATKMAVCPFMGSKAATDLPIYGSKDNPLVKVEDVIKSAGEGSLGEAVLRVFAEGNHSKMLGPSGKLDQDCPQGFMSLHLLGSQGAGPGRQKILHGDDPTEIGTGHLRPENFARLKTFADADGTIGAEGLGKAIGTRMFEERDDPNLKVWGAKVFALLGIDFAKAFTAAGPALFEEAKERFTNAPTLGGPAEVDFLQKLTKFTGENTLIASSGEWGLIGAFFEHAPGVKQADGTLKIPMDQLEAAFLKKELPAGADSWEKNASGWVRATTQILLAAAKEYHHLKTQHGAS